MTESLSSRTYFTDDELRRALSRFYPRELRLSVRFLSFEECFTFSDLENKNNMNVTFAPQFDGLLDLYQRGAQDGQWPRDLQSLKVNAFVNLVITQAERHAQDRTLPDAWRVRLVACQRRAERLPPWPPRAADQSLSFESAETKKEVEGLLELLGRCLSALSPRQEAPRSAPRRVAPSPGERAQLQASLGLLLQSVMAWIEALDRPATTAEAASVLPEPVLARIQEMNPFSVPTTPSQLRDVMELTLQVVRSLVRAYEGDSSPAALERCLGWSKQLRALIFPLFFGKERLRYAEGRRARLREALPLLAPSAGVIAGRRVSHPFLEACVQILENAKLTDPRWWLQKVAEWVAALEALERSNPDRREELEGLIARLIAGRPEDVTVWLSTLERMARELAEEDLGRKAIEALITRLTPQGRPEDGQQRAADAGASRGLSFKIWADMSEPPLEDMFASASPTEQFVDDLVVETGKAGRRFDRESRKKKNAEDLNYLLSRSRALLEANPDSFLLRRLVNDLVVETEKAGRRFDRESRMKKSAEDLYYLLSLSRALLEAYPAHPFLLRRLPTPQQIRSLLPRLPRGRLVFTQNRVSEVPWSVSAQSFKDWVEAEPGASATSAHRFSCAELAWLLAQQGVFPRFDRWGLSVDARLVLRPSEPWDEAYTMSEATIRQMIVLLQKLGRLGLTLSPSPSDFRRISADRSLRLISLQSLQPTDLSVYDATVFSLKGLREKLSLGQEKEKNKAALARALKLFDDKIEYVYPAFDAVRGPGPPGVGPPAPPLPLPTRTDEMTKDYLSFRRGWDAHPVFRTWRVLGSFDEQRTSSLQVDLPGPPEGPPRLLWISSSEEVSPREAQRVARAQGTLAEQALILPVLRQEVVAQYSVAIVVPATPWTELLSNLEVQATEWKSCTDLFYQTARQGVYVACDASDLSYRDGYTYYTCVQAVMIAVEDHLEGISRSLHACSQVFADVSERRLEFLLKVLYACTAGAMFDLGLEKSWPGTLPSWREHAKSFFRDMLLKAEDLEQAVGRSGLLRSLLECLQKDARIFEQYRTTVKKKLDHLGVSEKKLWERLQKLIANAPRGEGAAREAPPPPQGGPPARVGAYSFEPRALLKLEKTYARSIQDIFRFRRRWKSSLQPQNVDCFSLRLQPGVLCWLSVAGGGVQEEHATQSLVAAGVSPRLSTRQLGATGFVLRQLERGETILEALQKERHLSFELWWKVLSALHAAVYSLGLSVGRVALSEILTSGQLVPCSVVVIVPPGGEAGAFERLSDALVRELQAHPFEDPTELRKAVRIARIRAAQVAAGDFVSAEWARLDLGVPMMPPRMSLADVERLFPSPAFIPPPYGPAVYGPWPEAPRSPVPVADEADRGLTVEELEAQRQRSDELWFQEQLQSQTVETLTTLLEKVFDAPDAERKAAARKLVIAEAPARQVAREEYQYVRGDPKPSVDVVAKSLELLLGWAAAAAPTRVQRPVTMPVHPDFRKILRFNENRFN